MERLVRSALSHVIPRHIADTAPRRLPAKAQVTAAYDTTRPKPAIPPKQKKLGWGTRPLGQVAHPKASVILF